MYISTQMRGCLQSNQHQLIDLTISNKSSGVCYNLQKKKVSPPITQFLIRIVNCSKFLRSCNYISLQYFIISNFHSHQIYHKEHNIIFIQEKHIFKNNQQEINKIKIITKEENVKKSLSKNTEFQKTFQNIPTSNQSPSMNSSSLPDKREVTSSSFPATDESSGKNSSFLGIATNEIKGMNSIEQKNSSLPVATEEKLFKLPTDPKIYQNLISSELFIDKSLLISDILNHSSKNILVARPRGWGKTLNLSMIKTFLQMVPDKQDYQQMFVNKEVAMLDKININSILVLIKYNLKDEHSINWVYNHFFQSNYSQFQYLVGISQQDKVKIVKQLQQIVYAIFSDEVEAMNKYRENCPNDFVKLGDKYNQYIENLENRISYQVEKWRRTYLEYYKKQQEHMDQYREKKDKSKEIDQINYEILLFNFGKTCKHSNRFPVIYITFSNPKDNVTWDKTIRKNIAIAYQEHDYILTLLTDIQNSPISNQNEKNQAKIETEKFNLYLNENITADLTSSISFLVQILSKYLKVKVIILIDDHDAPIMSTIADEPENSEIISEIRDMYSSLENHPAIHLLLITGILPSEKSSLFLGLDKLKNITIFNYDLTERFGFVERDVKQILDRFNKGKPDNQRQEMDNLMSFYNGYIIGGVNIINPGSFIQCLDQTQKIKDSKEALKPYWINTSQHEYLLKMFYSLSDSENQIESELQQALKLFTHEYISFTPNMQINIQKSSIESFFTVLLHLGYLAYASKKEDNVFKLPNKEVKEHFIKTILPDLVENKIKVQMNFFKNLSENIGRIDSNFKDIMQAQFLDNYKPPKTANELYFQSFVSTIFNVHENLNYYSLLEQRTATRKNYSPIDLSARQLQTIVGTNSACEIIDCSDSESSPKKQIIDSDQITSKKINNSIEKQILTIEKELTGGKIADAIFIPRQNGLKTAVLHEYKQMRYQENVQKQSNLSKQIENKNESKDEKKQFNLYDTNIQKECKNNASHKQQNSDFENTEDSLLEDAMWQICTNHQVQTIFNVLKREPNLTVDSIIIRGIVFFFVDDLKNWTLKMKEYKISMKQAEDLITLFSTPEHTLLKDHTKLAKSSSQTPKLRKQFLQSVNASSLHHLLSNPSGFINNIPKNTFSSIKKPLFLRAQLIPNYFPSAVEPFFYSQASLKNGALKQAIFLRNQAHPVNQLNQFSKYSNESRTNQLLIQASLLISKMIFRKK